MPRTFSRGIITTDVDARLLVKTFHQLPKEIQAEIRQENLKNSTFLAEQVKGEITQQDPPQAELIKSAIKPVRDRNIKVSAGGTKQVGRAYKSRSGGRKYRAPAGFLVYGAEHGSSGNPTDRKGRKMGPRFVRPHNKDGYFLGPALREFAPRLLQIWSKTIQREIDKAGLK